MRYSMQRSHRWVLFLVLPTLLITISGMVALSREGDPEGDVYFRVGTSSSYEGKPRTRVEVFFDVPYEELNFLKSDDGYKAALDISVVFIDKAGEQAGGDVWRREIAANTFEETKMATKRFASYVEFRIPPGKYGMRARIEDLSSGRVGVIERDVNVRAFGGADLELSDPLFLHFLSDTVRFPNPSREYVQGARGALTFSAYRAILKDSITLETSLEDSRGEVWTSGPVLLSPVSEQTKTIVFSVDTFPADTFSFVLMLEDSVLARWPFVVRRPFFLDDDRYFDRVESMRYIASDAELKELKSAAPEERRETYNSFWKSRDPVPSTQRNEAEIDYFSRVDYSNRHFGGLLEGWKSDRGRIYIQYGKPDEVEKHPFEIDRYPYEIWYYYTSGYRFVFVDEHNLGRYELMWWEGR
jgi:GWxTD domain-containing protein